MTALSADEFPAFFKAVHGDKPFPWQCRLARQVVKEGRWPRLLDLPTGAGKTAAIDIAVFHLACEALRGPGRRAPLRTFFVIDRRIVVDAAFERARKIAYAFGGAEDGILKTVADRLRLLAGDGAPALQVVRLRGGMPQERDWARSPAQPLVAVSTVDQVGSRLLFRGYGVSQRMWPVHAGLVGSDALWLLDEVHLSKPLDETLDAIDTGHPVEGGGILAETRRLAPFAVVKLSATPGETADQAFGLSEDDRKHPTLQPRLTSRKVARLEAWDGDAAEAFCRSALHLADLASEPTTKKRKSGQFADSPPPVHRIAVVVNRVDLARRIFEKLKKSANGTAKILLLTGRVRPLDRDRIMEEIEPLHAVRSCPDPERPIILVATQTIEAGADLDVDALVTEIAPLDSLRQRFGRLDRLGLRRLSRAVILHPAAKKPKKDERNDWAPILRLYGESAYHTKEWLGKPGSEIDFGIDALAPKITEAAKNQKLEDLLAPRARAPVLLPAYTELWATTSPPPQATPEPALFLHGPGKPVDVQVIWRADIDPSREAESALSLDLCPPSSLEAMPVPPWAVRRWLCSTADGDGVADIPEVAPQVDRDSARGHPCFRRVDGGWSRAFPNDLRPGDTVVVPCSYGGCDRSGWNPREGQEVADLGAEAHYRQRLKGALRVTRETLANELAAGSDADAGAAFSQTWSAILTLVEEAGDDLDAEAIRASFVDIGHLPAAWRPLLGAMKGRSVEIEFYDDNDRTKGFVLFAKRALAPGLLQGSDAIELGDDAVTERADSWATGVRVELIEHLGHVEAKAREFAQRAGLDPRMTNLLALAGRMHDLGKADPRFQADLHGASALARLGLLDVLPGPLLAKSDKGGGRSTGQRAAPENFHHEALSVALAKRHPAVMNLDENDRDLVLWLVGTHHGYGHPFFPPCADSTDDSAKRTKVAVDIDEHKLAATPADAPLRLDQGWFERAERLNRRYGPWELARLEAILRLADHAASADEQEMTSGLEIKAETAKATS